MSKRNPTWLWTLALFAALVALATGIAGAAEVPSETVTQPATSPAVSPADPAVSPAAPQTPQTVAPPPLFLDTYFCSYEITGCGASGMYCTATCNVGQSCHCVVTYGHLPDGSCYVQRVGPGQCF